jgi:hypothetical protein
MYLARHVGGWSTTSIGKFYNGRDHSTVCHSIRRIESMRDENAELDQLLNVLCHELREQAPETHRKAESPGSRETPVDWADDGFLDMLVDRIVDRLLKSGNASARRCSITWRWRTGKSKTKKRIGSPE